MLEFIIDNYYVILIICVLLIFGIIGYIVDTLKNSQKNNVNELDTYVPEEEVFIQNTENDQEQENIQEEEQSAENLIEEYNNDKNPRYLYSLVDVLLYIKELKK